MTTPAVVEKQVVDIDFKRGLNEDYAPEDLDWTKWLKVADNVDFGYSGRINQRPGAWAFTATGTDDTNATMNPIYRLLATGDGALAVCGTGFNVCHLNEAGASSSSAFTRKNRASEYSVDPITVTGNAGTNPQIVGVAYTSAYNVIVYAPEPTSYAVFYVVWVDKASGNVVRKYQIDGTADDKAVMAMDTATDNLHVFVGGSGGCNLYVFPAAYVNSTNGMVSPTALTTGGIPLAAVKVGSSIYCVQNVAGACRVNKFTSGAEVANGAVAGFDTVHDAGTDGTKLYIIGINSTPRGLIKVVDSSLSVTRTVTDTDATLSAAKFSIGVDPSSNAYILAHYATATGSYNTPTTRVITCSSAATIFTSVQVMPGWGQVTSPFYNATNSEWYAVVVDLPDRGTGAGHDRTAAGGACCLVNLSSARTWNTHPIGFHIAAITDRYLDYVGINAPGYGYLNNVTTFSPQKLFSSDSGKNLIFGMAEKIGPSSYTAELRTLKMFDVTGMVCSSDVISGGKTGYYDGLCLSEIGSVSTPTLTVATHGSGNSLTTAGVYLYTCVFEFLDASGRRHISRCSNTFTYTSSDGYGTDVTMTFPNVTDHVAVSYGLTPSTNYNVRYAIYRTTNGTTQFYRITSGAADLTSATTAKISVRDTYQDSDISSLPLLHRQPGTLGTALDRYYAPASSCLTRHKDRVFVARGSDVYYSSFDVFGEAPWFNPNFSFFVPGGTGNITGLASLDGALIIFKKNAIFVVEGDGPPENGGNGTEFSPPRRLPSNIGCIDARTIVPTNDGIMFRSYRGIERLDRKMNVDWVGQRVWQTVNANDYSGGGAFEPSTGRAAWVISAYQGTYPGQLDSTNNGYVVVYDTSTDTWSRYVLRSTVGYGKGFQDVVASDIGSTNGLGFAGGPRMLFADVAKVFIEMPGVEEDYIAGSYYTIPVQLETGWVKPQSKQDRIKVTDFTIAGQKFGTQDGSLTVYYASDYSTTYTSVKSWSAANLNALGTVVQLETQPPKESVQAMSFKIVTETTTATNSAGLAIFGLSVRLGVKGGGVKLPSANKG